jgi:3-deoxy-manno-octulosonate cytidylyltransferase (CMP-KDO synthetase)
MRNIAIIPSRYDSKRFPGKPLASIAGKPMIQHVHHCARSCRDVSEVYVATDDERIFQCVEDFGGKAVMTQREHPSGTDRIAEAAGKLQLDADDLIINIQGDQPLFDPGLISHLIRPLQDDPEVPMGTLKYRIEDEKEIKDKNFVKVVTDRDGFALYFSRSPVPCFRDSGSIGVYYRHLGFYVYRRGFLEKFAGLPVGDLESAEKLEQLRALEYGYRIFVAECPSDSIEVDAPGDIQKVERRLAELNPSDPPS